MVKSGSMAKSESETKSAKLWDKCRSCGSSRVVDIVSFGDQYVPNFVDSPKEQAYSAPLDLMLCQDCSLLQLRHTFDQDLLYRKYWYRSAISSTMVKYLEDVIGAAERLVKLKPGDMVIDIGSNDGTTLRQFKSPGILKVGYEPSNLWELGKQENAVIIHDYFNAEPFLKQFPGKKVKILTSIAMFYDLERPNDFVEDVKKVLDKDGLWIIQMNYLGTMLTNNTYDNISHEHLEYYSLIALENLVNRHGMEVFDVEVNDVNGGSFRIFIRNRGSSLKANKGAEERLAKQREWERSMHLDTKEPYLEFAKKIEKSRDDLLKTLNKLKKEGKSVYIYGASNRGFIVLQFAKITDALIPKAVDLNEQKWGKYIVGTGIPIISIDQYRAEKPDYLFVLPYHFIDEIKKQESAYVSAGGKLIVAIPEVRIFEK